RLRVLAEETGLAGVAVESFPVRLGVLPQRTSAVIAEAGAGLLTVGDTVVDRNALAAEAKRLTDVLRRYHEAHPLDPGMSLQALRAAVAGPAPPPAVLDAILELGARERRFEVAGSVVRLPGWRPALDVRTSDVTANL